MKLTKASSRFSALRLITQLLFGISIVLTSNFAVASQVNITARYVPSVTNPSANQFENTTPNGGYCAQNPKVCTQKGLFSVSIPNETDYTPLIKGQPTKITIPNYWRDVTVTNAEGYSQTVKIKIVGMGETYNASTDVNTLAGGHEKLWEGGTWLNTSPGCTPTGSTSFTSSWYRAFWRYNTNTTCEKTPLFDLTPGIYFDELNFMYEMETPSPQTLSGGTYTGQLVYTIGPNGDFKLSNATSPDPVVILNFTLTVQNMLRIQFPAGSDRLTLQPEGGWQQWLYNGANSIPKKLLANEPYQLWTSGKFKMQLQCQYPSGSDCAMQNEKGTATVPVKTMVTMPYSVQSTSNTPVNHYQLSSDTPAIFKPSRYVNDEHAALNFEVDKAGVTQMVNSGGGRFRGNVTVIWDSQI